MPVTDRTAYKIATHGTVHHTVIMGTIAREAAEQAEERPPQSLVALTFSVAWVTAYFTDMLHWAASRLAADEGERLRSDVKQVRGQPERARAIVKACSGFSLDLGAQPLQDYGLVVDLRNALMHQEPETFALYPSEITTQDEPTRQAQLLKQLLRRGVFGGTQVDSLGALIGALHSPTVAKWAFNRAHATITAAQAQLPVHAPAYLLRSLVDPI